MKTIRAIAALCIALASALPAAADETNSPVGAVEIAEFVELFLGDILGGAKVGADDQLSSRADGVGN